MLWYFPSSPCWGIIFVSAQTSLGPKSEERFTLWTTYFLPLRGWLIILASAFVTVDPSHFLERSPFLGSGSLFLPALPPTALMVGPPAFLLIPSLCLPCDCLWCISLLSLTALCLADVTHCHTSKSDPGRSVFLTHY